MQEQQPARWSKTVYQVSLGADDEDAEGENDDTDKKTTDEAATTFYQMTSDECPSGSKHSLSEIGSKLTVDEKGTVYMIGCPSSVTIISSSGGTTGEAGHVVGTLTLDNKLPQQKHDATFTSINFGEDGYLYITSANELMRIKSRVQGMVSKLPTNMVVPARLKGPGRKKG